MKNYAYIYINGEWIKPANAKTIEVVNPATEQVCATIPSCQGSKDTEKAIAAARAGFERFSHSTIEERIALLERCIAAHEKYMDEMAEAVSTEMGAPMESLAKAMQAPIGLWHLQSTLAALQNYPFEEDLGTTRIFKEPVGVCGLITPWNWPVNQIACKVAPALATGCAVVLKPSVAAPLSGYVWAKIMHEAGVPAGVFNMVMGPGTVIGEILSSHPEVDMVSLTGSTRAGACVAQNAAAAIKRVALELGGKSANIILEDADLETAVSSGVGQLMHNTGQSCNAPSRMLVPASRLEEAKAIASKTAEQLVVGDPNGANVFMGPAANRKQFDTIQRCIEIGVAENCELVAGGPGKPEGLETGLYCKPTVFVTSPEQTLAREEIFGPVLVIIPYRDEEEAIAIANDSVYGLSGYVQSGDLAHARRVASRMRTGMVHLNGAPVDLAAPFGGYKQSGLGREWGAHGLDDYLEIKAVMGYTPEG